jgi:hypothetical protein
MILQVSVFLSLGKIPDQFSCCFEEYQDSDNHYTNDNAINSQVGQAKQTKTSTQRKVNKDNTNAQWYEATKLLKTRWVSGKRQYLVQWKDNSPSSWQYENDV